VAKKRVPIAIEELDNSYVIWCDEVHVRAISAIRGIIVEEHYVNSHLVVKLDGRYSKWELIREIEKIGYG
jgi:hypothetical protein